MSPYKSKKFCISNSPILLFFYRAVTDIELTEIGIYYFYLNQGRDYIVNL